MELVAESFYKTYFNHDNDGSCDSEKKQRVHRFCFQWFAEEPSFVFALRLVFFLLKVSKKCKQRSRKGGDRKTKREE